MAPVTRRSQNAGVAKQVNRKVSLKRAYSIGILNANQIFQKLVRKESSENWDFVQVDTSLARSYEGMQADHTSQPVHQNGHLDESDEEAPAFNLTARVDKVTEPLHEMANRVGQEVEAFAIKLDKFLEDLPTRDKYDAAYDLVLEYKAIAQDAVKRLEKDHVRERNQLLRREWREKVDLSVGPGARSVTSELGRVDQIQGVKELRQWQAEVDTWELFRLVLELRSRPEDDERRLRDKEDRLAALGAPNRYTPESKIWERFLLESDVAKERSLILRWLEETANHQESEVSDIVEELEVKAGRGRGLWSHGWMNTREKIKGQKRMGGVLERGVVPPAKIRRSDNGDQLVSTLDPDAASRERATLEKPDTYLDRAFWTVCWEMLRRGKSWHEICDWCEERNEGWRAISLRKASHQASSDLGVAWRRMCRIAATDDCSNPYEAAVYGLLGGDPASSDKVCRTYDDYMYSHYSNNLARQFDQYIMQQLPERIPKALRKHLWSDESLREDFEALVGIAKLLRALRESPKTKDEARQPMKLIQSYLLARETGSFINTLGFAISDAAHANEQVEDTLVRLRDPPARDTEEWLPESGIAEDHDALRISAHMCIILLKIQDEQLTQDERESQDNVIVAYMQFLRKDRKPDLLPLYASCLSTGARAEMSMSRMLQDVGDGPAQRQLIKLMQTYNLNAKEILVQQTNYHLEKFLKKYTALPALRILEDSDDTLYPGQRVRSKYLPEASSKEEEDLVQSLQWWQLLDGDWRVTFGVLARVCLKLLGEHDNSLAFCPNL